MGPQTFRFEVVVIDRVVPESSSGNFVLGEKDDSGEFVPRYVGRSDVDLRAELRRTRENANYPFFKFSVASPRNAFDMECSHFHLFASQLTNKNHPTRPQGSDFVCFICGL